MDEVLAHTLSRIDSNTTLIALSDHGFSPFYREFNVNTWLLENGFLTMTDRSKQEESDFYQNVDWAKTKAYGLGLNAIYVNLAGREPNGWVASDEAAAIKKSISEKLLTVRDPLTREPVATSVYDSRDIYSGPFLSLAPDIVIGYNRGYRISDEAVLGKFPRDIVANRTDKWSADHCMDSKTL